MTGNHPIYGDASVEDVVRSMIRKGQSDTEKQADDSQAPRPEPGGHKDSPADAA